MARLRFDLSEADFDIELFKAYLAELKRSSPPKAEPQPEPEPKRDYEKERILRLQAALVDFGFSSVEKNGEYNPSTATAVRVVKWLQQKLGVLGYLSGKPDGWPGKNTITALISFQRVEGMKVSGKISSGLGDALSRCERILAAARGGSDRLEAGQVYYVSPGVSPAHPVHVLLRMDGTDCLYTVSEERITAKDCGDRAVELGTEITRGKVEAASDDSIQFLHMARYNPGARVVQITVGKRRIEVPASEWISLTSGDTKPLPTLDAIFANSPPTIVFRDLFERAATQNPDKHISSMLVAYQLKRRYGPNFYLDDEMVLARQNLTSLPRLARKSDVVMYRTPDESFASFDPQTIALIHSIEGLMRDNAIDVRTDFAKAEARNVIVLAGHKEKALLEYIKKLGSNGVFKGKVVAVFSCFDHGDSALNSSLIRGEAGAKAVFSFPTTINPVAVEAVLEKLVKLLDGSPKDVSMYELLEQSISAVSEEVAHPQLKQYVEQLRDGVLQISEALMPTETVEA